MPYVVPSDVVQFIEKVFPPSHNEISIHSGTLNFCETLLNLVEHLPDNLLTLDSSGFAALVAAQSLIRSDVSSYRGHIQAGKYSHYQVKLVPVEEFGNINPVQIIRRELSKCPDQAPTSSTSELLFISDTDYRRSLRQDLSTITNALANHGWKAATVLSGSVIEALLLWALTLRTADIPIANGTLVQKGVLPSKRVQNVQRLENWDLEQYIWVAKELNEVEEQTAAIANTVRDFRNLIHPGRVIRTSQQCTRGMAHVAYGAVERVVEDLTKRHP